MTVFAPVDRLDPIEKAPEMRPGGDLVFRTPQNIAVWIGGRDCPNCGVGIKNARRFFSDKSC